MIKMSNANNVIEFIIKATDKTKEGLQKAKDNIKSAFSRDESSSLISDNEERSASRLSSIYNTLKEKAKELWQGIKGISSSIKNQAHIVDESGVRIERGVRAISLRSTFEVGSRAVREWYNVFKICCEMAARTVIETAQIIKGNWDAVGESISRSVTRLKKEFSDIRNRFNSDNKINNDYWTKSYKLHMSQEELAAQHRLNVAINDGATEDEIEALKKEISYNREVAEIEQRIAEAKRQQRMYDKENAMLFSENIQSASQREELTEILKSSGDTMFEFGKKVNEAKHIIKSIEEDEKSAYLAVMKSADNAGKQALSQMIALKSSEEANELKMNENAMLRQNLELEIETLENQQEIVRMAKENATQTGIIANNKKAELEAAKQLKKNLEDELRAKISTSRQAQDLATEKLREAERRTAKAWDYYRDPNEYKEYQEQLRKEAELKKQFELDFAALQKKYGDDWREKEYNPNQDYYVMSGLNEKEATIKELALALEGEQTAKEELAVIAENTRGLAEKLDELLRAKG